MPDQSRALAEPLIQGAVPRRDHFGWKVVALFALHSCLGFAAILGYVPCRYVGVRQHQIVQEPAISMSSIEKMRLGGKELSTGSLLSASSATNNFGGLVSDDDDPQALEIEEKGQQNDIVYDDLTTGFNGTVNMWNSEKRFGVILASGEATGTFCPGQNLLDGMLNLEKGDQVTFSKAYNKAEKRYEAVQVQRVSGSVSATGSGQEADSGATPAEVPELGHETEPEPELPPGFKSGRLKFWSIPRGYGLVIPRGGGEDIFCHYRGLASGEIYKTLQPDDQVMYYEIVMEDRKKVEAAGLRLVGDKTVYPGDENLLKDGDDAAAWVPTSTPSFENDDNDAHSVLNGKVFRYNDKRAYGVIQPTGSASGGEIFFHKSGLIDNGLLLPVEGDLVTFRKELDGRLNKGKYRAEQIRFADIANKKGIMKRWNFERGFGIITYRQADIFCHRSNVQGGRETTFENGDPVIFSVEFSEQKGKYEAVKVRFDGDELNPGLSPVSESAVDSIHDAGSEIGKLSRWNAEKGFGLIQPSDGMDVLFCHVSSLADGEDSVTEGDQVTFRRMFNDRKGKDEAVEVKRIASRGGDGRGAPAGAFRSAAGLGLGSGDVSHGTILFNSKKGFGLIEPSDGGTNLVFGHNDMNAQLEQGDLVTFRREINAQTGKEEAVDVRQDNSRGFHNLGAGQGSMLQDGMERLGMNSGADQTNIMPNMLQGRMNGLVMNSGVYQGSVMPSMMPSMVPPMMPTMMPPMMPSMWQSRMEGSGMNSASNMPSMYQPNTLHGRMEQPGMPSPQAYHVGVGAYGGVPFQPFHSMVNVPSPLANMLNQDCGNLQELYLDWKQIGDAGVELLTQALPRCRSLVKLYLNNNGIGDLGVSMLAKVLPGCATLEFVYLRWNYITDNGARELAHALPHFTNLQVLDLTWNQISDAGAEALSQALQCCPNLKVDILPQANNAR